MTRDAFAVGASPASGQEARDLSAALDQLHAAMQQQGGPALSGIFDVDRLCDELARLSTLSSSSLALRNGALAQIRGAVLINLRQNPALSWDSHQVKKVTMSENRREAVVYDLQFHGQGPARFSIKMRWWMCKDAGQWKVWDFEALEEGMRLTSNMDAAMAAAVAGGTQGQTITQGATEIRNADAYLRKGDYPNAEKRLKTLDGMTLAPFLIATRQYTWASLHLRQARYSDVISDCDSIVATGQDVPGMFEFRATAENKLGRYEAALATTDKWETALGPDRELYYERGFALTHLHRPAEAAVAFGKSLDEDPDSAGSLAELSQVLPAGQKEEVAVRFSRARTPGEVFTRAVPILQRKRDLEGMRILIAAYRARPESANDSWLNYYDAELKVISKQYREAEAELLPLLPQAGEEGKQVFASEYLYSSRLAGDAIRAYGNMPDQRAAFKQLAQPLLRDGMKTTLADLVARHEQKFPDDPWPHYYQARLDETTSAYDAAEVEFAKAMSLEVGKNVETFRAARVLARYKAGNGLSAYRDIAPQDKTFRQLAMLYASAKRADDLSKLVDARRADRPDDPGVPLWDAQAKFLSGDYAAAVQLLSEHRDDIQKEQSLRYKWSDLYIRCQVRLRHFDEARKQTNGSSEDERNWFQVAIVECAAGDVARGTEALNTLLRDDEDTTVADFYADPDIGPALATPAFAAWRAKHPRPAKRAASSSTSD